jgi:hypothetical protein
LGVAAVVVLVDVGAVDAAKSVTFKVGINAKALLNAFVTELGVAAVVIEVDTGFVPGVKSVKKLVGTFRVPKILVALLVLPIFTGLTPDVLIFTVLPLIERF